MSAPRAPSSGSGSKPEDSKASGAKPPLFDHAAHLREYTRRTIIGVPWRDDAHGAAHANDLQLVAAATGATAVTLHPPQIHQGAASAAAAPAAASVVAPRPGHHATLITGGPFNIPGTTAQRENPAHEPKGGRVAARLERHEHETAEINDSIKRNKPVLAVCGGSWRLAAALGGDVTPIAERATQQRHNGPYSAPNEFRHDVETVPNSLLSAVTGGHPFPSNSVHWSTVSFPNESRVRVTAHEPGTRSPEGFEMHRALHPFVVGVQWHPEYAAQGLRHGGADMAHSAAPHASLMTAFGHAAAATRAASTIQRMVRAHNTRKNLEKARNERNPAKK